MFFTILKRFDVSMEPTAWNNTSNVVTLRASVVSSTTTEVKRIVYPKMTFCHHIFTLKFQTYRKQKKIFNRMLMMLFFKQRNWMVIYNGN